MRTMPSATDITLPTLRASVATREVLDSLTDQVADFRCLDRHDLISFKRILYAVRSSARRCRDAPSGNRRWSDRPRAPRRRRRVRDRPPSVRAPCGRSASSSAATSCALFAGAHRRCGRDAARRSRARHLPSAGSKICAISGRNGRRLFSASSAMKLRPWSDPHRCRQCRQTKLGQLLGRHLRAAEQRCARRSSPPRLPLARAPRTRSRGAQSAFGAARMRPWHRDVQLSRRSAMSCSDLRGELAEDVGVLAPDRSRDPAPSTAERHGQIRHLHAAALRAPSRSPARSAAWRWRSGDPLPTSALCFAASTISFERFDAWSTIWLARSRASRITSSARALASSRLFWPRSAAESPRRSSSGVRRWP